MVERDFKEEVDWIWLAAIIDGEGWIGIRNDSRRRKAGLPGLTVHMTDADVVTQVAKAFECNMTTPANRNKPPHFKVVYSAQLTGAKVIPILEHIRPYMSARRTNRIDEVISHTLSR